MYQTMTQIGRAYDVDAKTVGRILYILNIRDENHPEQKGFPFEQAVTHGIAKAYTGRTGEKYYRYDIERIKVEFETALDRIRKQSGTAQAEPADLSAGAEKHPAIASHLNTLLDTLNHALRTGELGELHKMKGIIADIYTLLPA